MNNISDTLSNKESDKVETVRQDQKPTSDGTLIELGKVSDTQGGWLGSKVDGGAGFQTY